MLHGQQYVGKHLKPQGQLNPLKVLNQSKGRHHARNIVEDEPCVKDSIYVYYESKTLQQ